MCGTVEAGGTVGNLMGASDAGTQTRTGPAEPIEAGGLDPSPAGRPAVAASGLELRRGDRTVLAASDLVVPAGVRSALVGPNGAGKSSLLHALAGLLAPAAGRADVPALHEPAGVAYVLQGTVVDRKLPLTVRETVTMARYRHTGLLRRLGAEDRAAIDEALEALELTGLADRQLGELSGGQRQRALVAQGLAQQASLLLLDEPASGLDVVSRQRIAEVIESLVRSGTTVIVATHDLGDALRADHVVLLAGRVVSHGEPAAALSEDRLVEAYGGRLVQVGGRTLLLDGH